MQGEERDNQYRELTPQELYNFAQTVGVPLAMSEAEQARANEIRDAIYDQQVIENRMVVASAFKSMYLQAAFEKLGNRDAEMLIYHRKMEDNLSAVRAILEHGELVGAEILKWLEEHAVVEAANEQPPA